jgi:hypothetical protein
LSVQARSIRWWSTAVAVSAAGAIGGAGFVVALASFAQRDSPPVLKARIWYV